MINKGPRTKYGLVEVERMNSYFGLEVLKSNNPKDEVLFIADKLKLLDSEGISNLIDMFGETLTRHYLEKQRLLGNTFTHGEIEPFINYLDSYLIEQSGGNKKELNHLSSYLTGERFDYPTQRLIRLSILDRYFSPYMQG